MKLLWPTEPIWKGETVAILACGPSMSQEVADSVRGMRCIVVNRAHQLAPLADMLVALDGVWPDDFKTFAGLRVCGVAENVDATHYVGPAYEEVALEYGNVVHIRNSGLTAIRIAAATGAAKILLYGFDTEQRGHCFEEGIAGQSDAGEPYIGLTAGLTSLIAELRAAGIEVEHITQ